MVYYNGQAPPPPPSLVLLCTWWHHGKKKKGTTTCDVCLLERPQWSARTPYLGFHSKLFDGFECPVTEKDLWKPTVQLLAATWAYVGLYTSVNYRRYHMAWHLTIISLEDLYFLLFFATCPIYTCQDPVNFPIDIALRHTCVLNRTTLYGFFRFF